MEKVQRRVKEAVDQMFDDLDRRYMRCLQKDMFLCSSKCCDNSSMERSDFEDCVENCNKKLKFVQNCVEREMSTFQGQLSRCAMSCYDRLAQKYGPDPGKYKSEQSKLFADQLEKCVADCADDHMKLLPKIKERIVANI